MASWTRTYTTLAWSAICAVTLGLASARGAANTWDGDTSTDWSDLDNWSLGSIPSPGDDVSIPSGTTYAPTLTNATEMLGSFALASGQTLTVDGWNSAIRATNITVAGTITHLANTVTTTNALGEWVPLHRVLLEGSNIILAVGGKINTDYLGYPPGAGPGAGGASYGSAAHAGDGVRAYGNSAPGAAYGDPAAPEQPGSGGGLYVYSRPAGGAVKIVADGQLTVHGEIRANGQNAYTTHGSGGSGGSIWLTCHTFAGSATGLITVNAGNGNYYGSAGSAGRIALHYNQTAQAGLPQPQPPVRFAGKGGNRGRAAYYPAAMSTLYLPDALLITNGLSGDRFQYTRLVIPGFTEWTVANQTLDGCILGLPDGFDLNVTGDLVLTNGAGLYLFPVPVADPLTMDGMLVEIGNDLRVHDGCWIRPYSVHTNGATVRFTVGGDLYVEAGGGFDADYIGYFAANGPGKPPGTSGAGPGHGGVGGEGFGGNAPGIAYGEPANPILPGSGGNGALGGYGGSSIRIEVGGEATIHGLLTASGGHGFSTHAPAGAGGTINIRCGTLQGSNTGLLRADGGWGNYYGGSGGGGRIAVMYDPVAQAGLGNPRPPVRFSTHAYRRSSRIKPTFPAEMGTVCFPDLTLLTDAPTNPVSLVDHRFWHTRLILTNDELDAWAPASLFISNCVFTLPDGMELEVAGDLTVASGGALPSDLQTEAANTYGPAGPMAGVYIDAVKTNARYGARLDIGGDLRVVTNSWLFPGTCGTNGAVVGILVGGDVIVDAGGGINADDLGYRTLAGNANGPGAGQHHYYGGGGYGGIGGAANGGTNYGLAELPLEPGSPAGWNGYGGGYGVGGNGGGAIHVQALGSLTINGTFTANGQQGNYYTGAAGSGGGIFLSCRSVSGSGTLSAVGGVRAGSTDAYGGGGRIAVWYGPSPHKVPERIGEMNLNDLVFSYPYAGFSGDVLVDSGGGVLAEDGTKGFYYVPPPQGTLVIIR